MPSKASLALVFCLALGSTVTSLPVKERRSHHHADGVAAVVTQTVTTTTTTVTSAVAVDDKHHHHHHHHHNGTAAAVDPAHQDAPADSSTPAKLSVDNSTATPPSLESRGWFSDLFRPKPQQQPATSDDSAKPCNKDVDPNAPPADAPQLSERDFFDSDFDFW